MGALKGLLWAAMSVCFLGAIISFIAQTYSESEKTGEYGKRPERGYRHVKGPAWLGVFFLVMALFTSCLVQVDSGYRGVVVRLGAVTERTLGEGLHMIVPFIEKVPQMIVQVEAREYEASAASRDLQDVKTNVTINYSLDPTRVNKIYQDLRFEYEPRIIKPAVQEAVKAVTAKFDAEELITRRADVKEGIRIALQTRLDVHGIIVDTVNITNFEFSAAYTQAIEAKVVAAQAALEAENKLREIEVEARQAETRAKGQANAVIAIAEGQRQAAILEAQGQAEAIRISSQAQAEANKVINASLTDLLIRYNLAINIAPGVQTIILPAGQEFILGPEILGGKR